MHTIEDGNIPIDPMQSKIIEYQDRLLNEYHRTLSIYKLLAWALGIIFAFGITAFYFLYNKNVSSIRQDMQEQVNIIRERVQTRIDQEFETPKITSLIEKKAIEQVQNQIDPIAHLYSYIPMANYNIKYFDELIKISEHKEFAFPYLKEMASESVKQVKITLDARYREADFDTTNSSFPYFDLLGSKPTDWNLDDFKKNFPLLTSSRKGKSLDFLWKQREKFSNYNRLQFLYEVIKTDTDVYAIYVACALMNEEAKIDKDFLYERDAYLKWWESSKDRFLEKNN